MAVYSYFLEAVIFKVELSLIAASKVNCYGGVHVAQQTKRASCARGLGAQPPVGSRGGALSEKF